MKPLIFALLAASLFGQDAGPKPAPEKTIEQQLSEAKADNENLKKLLNVWVRKAENCDVSLTTAQTLGMQGKQ